MPDHISPRARWWPMWALVLAVSVLVGASTANAPAVAWLLVGALMGLMLLRMPTAIWVGWAILLSGVSRLLVYVGLLPGIANFFHFPLALGAVLVASMSRSPRTRLSTHLATGLVALLAASFASWALNGGEITRPILLWLVFAEPLMIVYALVRSRVSPRHKGLLWALLLALVLVQLPLGLFQAATLGPGDTVQGTFPRMGAGHHVAGALALLGTLVYIGRAMVSDKLPRTLGALGIGALLILVPLLADAKQAFAAFLLAAGYLILASGSGRLLKGGVFVGTMAVLALWSISNFQAFGNIFNYELAQAGLRGKVDSLVEILSRGPSSWVLGHGPGNTVSRVALMALEEYAKIDSSAYLLALKPAQTTRRIWDRTFSNWLFASSSAWSGIASWLGLFGDLGLVGTAIYVSLCLRIWRAVRENRRWASAAARASLVMAGLLGFIYSWLEEPGFILPVALLTGLGLISGRERP